MRFLSLLVLISFLGTACSSAKKSADKEMERREAEKKEKQEVVVTPTEKTEVKKTTETETTVKKVEKVQPIVVEEQISDVEADEIYQYPVAVQSSAQSQHYQSQQYQAIAQPVIIQQAPTQVQYDSEGDIIAYKTVTTTTVEEFDVEDQASSSSETTTVTSSSNSDSEVLRYVDNNYGEIDRYTVQDFHNESSDIYVNESNNDQLVVISRPASSSRVVSYSGDFSSGLYQVSKTCNLRSTPSKSSSALGYVSTGKVVWAENATSSFAKVYRKSGPAYLHKGCL